MDDFSGNMNVTMNVKGDPSMLNANFGAPNMQMNVGMPNAHVSVHPGVHSTASINVGVPTVGFHSNVGMGGGMSMGVSGVNANINVPQPNVVISTPVYPVEPVVIVTKDPEFNADVICGQQIPYLDSTTALIILILNIIIPGLGTMLVGCLGRNANCVAWFLIGLAQDFLTAVCVGWIWSILTGLAIYKKSNEQPRNTVLLQP